MWQRWLSVTECARDLQASGALVPYWKVWEWVRWHCSWRKEGNRVLVSERSGSGLKRECYQAGVRHTRARALMQQDDWHDSAVRDGGGCASG
jgi:hypothetical protein